MHKFFFNVCVPIILFVSLATASCKNEDNDNNNKGKTAASADSTELRIDAIPMTTPRLEAYMRRYDSVSKIPGFDSTKSEIIVSEIDSVINSNSKSFAKNLPADLTTLFLPSLKTARPKNDTLWIDFEMRKANTYLKNFTSASNPLSPMSMAVSDGGSKLTDIETIERGVTWLFDEAGSNPPTRIEGYASPISIFGTNLIRGWYGARACGNWAVFLTVCGDKDGGLSWLKAAQAHTPEVSNLFEKYPDYTISYAIKKYGVRALVEHGFTYYSAGLLIKEYLEKSFKNYHPAPWPKPTYDNDGTRATAGGVGRS